MYKISCILVICWSLQTCGQPWHEEPVNIESITSLASNLTEATSEAELLYAQYSSRASKCLKAFLNRTHSIGNDSLDTIDKNILTYGPSNCRSRLDLKLKNIRHQAHVAAEYNADNHQKFFLSHMVVIRMHLNKTSLFLRKAEAALRSCSPTCRTVAMQKRMSRWQMSARQELSRARSDLDHATLAYRDLMTHASRRLGRIDKQANKLVLRAISELYQCTNRV